MLEMRNIKKKYINENREVDIEIEKLSIDEGMIYGIIGESGSGKTTILRILSGLEESIGKILFRGKEIQDIPAEERNMTMIFQKSLLLPFLNVEENISLGMKFKGISRTKREAKVKELLKAVNLEGFETQRISKLSGGQMQRVAIARALAIEPDIILLDEPFSSLDQNLKVEMRSLIKQIQREQKTTMIFVSHDPEDGSELFDKSALMADGKLIREGSWEELKEEFKETEYKRLFGV